MYIVYNIMHRVYRNITYNKMCGLFLFSLSFLDFIICFYMKSVFIAWWIHNAESISFWMKKITAFVFTQREEERETDRHRETYEHAKIRTRYSLTDNFWKKKHCVLQLQWRLLHLVLLYYSCCRHWQHHHYPTAYRLCKSLHWERQWNEEEEEKRRTENVNT